VYGGITDLFFQREPIYFNVIYFLNVDDIPELKFERVVFKLSSYLLKKKFFDNGFT